MSLKTIPEHIDPYRFSEQQLRLEGCIGIEQMTRLANTGSQLKQPVVVKLQFNVDEQGTAFVRGHLESVLLLQCQRCMEPFSYGIMSDFALGIVNTLDEANALPERYEPALAKEGNLALRELIEDEVILNLPIIPRHEPEDCKVKLPLAADSGWEHGKGENPFHVLESLKHKRR